MKTRISFFILTTALFVFGDVAQAATPWSRSWSAPTDFDAGRARRASGLSVRFDPETGVNQVYYTPMPRGRVLRLTETTSDKSAPAWGPEGVTYYFYDRAENVILTCTDGDLFYDLAGAPPILEMGCVAGKDSLSPVVISGYPLSAFAGGSEFAVEDYHVAFGEDIYYEAAGIVHAAYPVVVETSDDTEVLVLHDDEAHLGESEYEDGFVSYYDVVVVDDASGNVVTGIPDDAWDGTVICDDCPGSGIAEQDGADECGENEDTASSGNDGDDVAVSIPSETDAEAESVSNSSSGDQTITIYNEITVTSGSTSGDVNAVQEQNQAEATSSDAEPSVTPDVSTEATETSGGYAMSGDAIGNCGLNASNARHESAAESAIGAACFVLLVLTRILCRLARRIRGATACALTVVLIAQQAASPAWALQADAGAEKIVVVPAGHDASALLPLTRELRRQLRGLNVLSVDAALQNLSLGGGNAPEIRQALSRLDVIWDDYDAYRKGDAETRSEFAEALAGMRSNLPLGAESSRLLMSTTLALAWFEFKLGNRADATRELNGIFNLSPETVSLDAYPKSFRSFAEQSGSRERGRSSSGLSFSSVPEAVNAYVDGIFVGVTPLRVALKPGTYWIGFEAVGRSPVVRNVVVTDGKTRDVRARLPWMKASARRHSGGSIANWNDANAAEKMSIAAGIARASQSDVAVAVSVKKTRAGFVPTVTAYDARSGRMTKEIAYSRPLAHFSERTDEVVSELAGKLSDVLRSRRLVSGTRGMDREIAVDPAARRGAVVPLYKKPAFWAALGGVAAAGVIAGVLASQGSSSGPGTGGLVVGF